MESEINLKNLITISETDFEIGCRVLDESVRLLFRKPGIEEEYQEFLKTYEEPKKKVRSDKTVV